MALCVCRDDLDFAADLGAVDTPLDFDWDAFPTNDDEGEVGEIVTITAAVAAATALADAMGIDLTKLVTDGLKSVGRWVGIGTCSKANKRKYQKMVANASLEELTAWLRKGKVGGSTGSCRKYANARAIRRVKQMEAEARRRPPPRRQNRAYQDARAQWNQARRRRRQVSTLRNLRAEQDLVRRERKRRDNNNLMLGLGAAAAVTAGAVILHRRRPARDHDQPRGAARAFD